MSHLTLNICQVLRCLSNSYIQSQYIFIYDSVLESLVCGETQIEVHNLRRALKKLNVVDQETGKNGFEKQFQVRLMS